MVISNGGGRRTKDEGAQTFEGPLTAFAIAWATGGHAVEQVGEGLLVASIEVDKGGGDDSDVGGVGEAVDDVGVDADGAGDDVEVGAVVDAATAVLLADRAAFPRGQGQGPADGGARGIEAGDLGEQFHECVLRGVVGVGFVVQRCAGELQAQGPQRRKHRRRNRAIAGAEAGDIKTQATTDGRIHGSDS